MKERKQTISEAIEREDGSDWIVLLLPALRLWATEEVSSADQSQNTPVPFPSSFSLIWREIANNCQLGNEMTLGYRGRVYEGYGKKQN